MTFQKQQSSSVAPRLVSWIPKEKRMQLPPQTAVLIYICRPWKRTRISTRLANETNSDEVASFFETSGRCHILTHQFVKNFQTTGKTCFSITCNVIRKRRIYLATPCELNENSNDDEVQEIHDQNSAMEDVSKFFEQKGS